MVLLKTILFTIIVPGTVTVYVPYRLLSSQSVSKGGPSHPIHYGGLLPLLVGVAVYLWCAWDFTMSGNGTPAPIDAPRKLVVRGLYRYVRNPMYVGVLAALLGEALWFSSLRLLEYTGWVFLFFYLLVVFYEEPTLERKFGEPYQRYRQSVPRWIPGM